MRAKYNNPLAVNVKSQKEWDFVSEKLGYKWNNPNRQFEYFNGYTCINLMYRSFCDISYYESKNYNILSFEEWLKLMGYDNPFKPKLIVRVFTRSKNKITLIAQGIGQTWLNDESNETSNTDLQPCTTNDNSKQKNFFYNYRYEK